MPEAQDHCGLTVEEREKLFDSIWFYVSDMLTLGWVEEDIMDCIIQGIDDFAASFRREEGK